MVNLNKEEAKAIIKELNKSKDKKIKEIINKMSAPKIRIRYVRSQLEIKKMLRKAFKEKKILKIQYYSHSSNEVTTRMINIYKKYEDCIIAYCHLRKDERTFVIRKINAAALLNESYNIPKNWKPDSIILN